MNEPLPKPPSRAWSLVGAAALMVSLALNLGLVMRLLRPGPGSAGTVPAFRQANLTNPPTAAAQPVVAAFTNAPDAAASPPFRWSEVESDDYRQYIANLRAVGCPEPVIRDLIAADLNQLFAPRVAAIWQPRKSEYWQKYANDQPNPDQLKALKALNREQSAVYEDLLGSPLGQQSQIDLVYLQVQGPEAELLHLPDDKREAALKVLAVAGYLDKEMELHSQPGGYLTDAETKLFNEKLQLLSQVLTPDEVEEFRLRNAPAAQSLRTEVGYFDCTPEEFQRLLDARERSGGKVLTGDLSNRGPAIEQARELFGEERAQEFEKTTDIHYISARRELEQAGLPIEAADEAWQITREIRTATDRVANDHSLSVDERKRQVRALQEQANQRLNAALGEKYARSVRQNLGVVFQVAEMNLKP